MSSTVITDYNSFDAADSMVFMQTSKNEIPSAPGKPAIKFFRVPIRVRNPDGSTGQLVFAPSNLFTFGVSENKGDNDMINGYTLPLVLWNKEGATDDQLAFTAAMESIIEACKQHLVKDDVRKSIGKPTLKYDALEKLDKLLYWKLDESGLRVPDKSPSMYPKLYTSRTDNGAININTEFFDSQGQTVDPFQLIGKYGYTKPALVFDCIYVGATMSIQVRVAEAEINLVNNKRRFLSRPTANTTLQDPEAEEKPRLMSSAPAVEATSYTQATTGEDASNFIIDDGGSDGGPEPVAAAPTPVRTAPKKLPARAKKA